MPAYGNDLQNPDALINRANKRAVKGDLAGAIADFDAAIDINPAKATAFYNRGYLQNLAGNYQLAIEDCNQAIALLPEYDEAFYQRGLAQYELGDLNGALVDLSEALRLNPFSIKAYYKRAACYAKLENIEGAVADYTQAILHVPKDSNAYLQRGRFLTELKEYRTAVEDFTAAISYNPKNADAYYHRGICYAELEEKEKANQDFNQAMLYNPNQRAEVSHRTYALGILKSAQESSPSSSLATTPNKKHQTELPSVDLKVETPQNSSLGTEPTPKLISPVQSTPVRSELTQPSTLPQSEALQSPHAFSSSPGMEIETLAESMEPDEIDQLFKQAQQLANAGDLKAAIQKYSKIIALEPENTQAYYQRCKIYNSLGDEDSASSDIEDAIHWAQVKSLDLMKDYSGELSETIANLKQSLANIPKATPSPQENSIETSILNFSRIIHRNPSDASAYFERGKSRALLGDLEGAIADYSRTIRLDPNHRDAFYKRGMLLGALGDIDGATRDMDQAIRRNPMLPPVGGLKRDMSPSESGPSEIRKIYKQKSPTKEIQSKPTDSTDFQPLQTVELHHGKTKDQSHIILNHDPQESPTEESLEPLSVDINLPASQAIAPPPSNNREAFSLNEPSRQHDQKSDIDLESYSVKDVPETPNGTMISDISIHTEQESSAISVNSLENYIPSRFTDAVMEPCNHAGTLPGHRYCIRCGQPLFEDKPCVD